MGHEARNGPHSLSGACRRNFIPLGNPRSNPLFQRTEPCVPSLLVNPNPERNFPLTVPVNRQASTRDSRRSVAAFPVWTVTILNRVSSSVMSVGSAVKVIFGMRKPSPMAATLICSTPRGGHSLRRRPHRTIGVSAKRSDNFTIIADHSLVLHRSPSWFHHAQVVGCALSWHILM